LITIQTEKSSFNKFSAAFLLNFSIIF